MSLNTDFSQVSASYSLTDLFSGTVTLANASNQYGSADRWSVISITVDSAVIDEIDISNSAPFAGTVVILNGVVTSPLNDWKIANNSFSINVSSFFSTLNRKSLNTQTYTGTVGAAIADILTNYCGLPLALYSISISNNVTLQSVVSGTDAYAEVVKLAEVGLCDCFCQVGGQLVIEPWKGPASPVDLVIPSEAIMSVSKRRSTEKGVTRVMVKGRFTGDHNCGPKSIFQNHSNPTQLKKDKCYMNGIPEPSSRVVFKNLSADKQDINNASFVLTGDLTFDHMNSKEQQNSLAVLYASEAGTPHFVENVGLKTITSLILSRNTGNSSETGDGVDRRVRGVKRGLKTADRVFAKMAGLPPGTVLAPDQTSESGDSDDRNRITVSVVDTGLISEFGIVQEDLDNEYIPDGFTAFLVALRRFQTFRMQRNTYQVQLMFLAGLAINDVVSFDLPDGSDTITGRVTSLKYSHTANPPKTVIDLEVQSFEELGTTAYVSPNLFVYPECCGINQIDWVSSGEVFASSGFFLFGAGSSVYQPMVLTTGLTYIITVEVTLLTGPGSFRVAHYNNGVLGATTTLSGSGTATLSIGPTHYNQRIEFASLSGEWALTKPRMTVSLIG